MSVLNVRHVWQLDPESGVPLDQRRSVCAPAAVNIVLDYMLGRTGNDSFKVVDIIALMEKAGGRVNGVGWKHSAGVGALNAHGLIAWRRNWLAPSQDPRHFIEVEGYDDRQVRAFLAQLAAEEQVEGSIEEKALHSIKRSIDDNCPVIASVKAGFSENEGYHQIVIAGYGETDRGEWLDIVDPLLPADKQTRVGIEYFLSYYKLQSIFVKSPD